MEERDDVLWEDLEIEMEAKRKARKTTIRIIVGFAIIIAILLGISEAEFTSTRIISLIISSIMVIGCIVVFAKYTFPYAYEQSEKAKRSIAYTDLYLSKEKYVRVIHNTTKNAFVLKLQSIAKFYAIITETGYVKIYIKFDFEEEKEEMCKYEVIHRERFYDYYHIMTE